MGAPNRKEVNNSMERYQSLKLKESLSEPSRYALACKELSFILKNAFAECPKNLQSHLFQETLFAFSLLPSMHSMSAADSLLQSTAVLPKQKRALAVAEYKHAVVASKRKQLKGNQEKQELPPLPKDVLVHIFSFLDLQSLVSASAVCWSWNAAANENCLWQSLHMILAGPKAHGATTTNIEWRSAFKTAYKDDRCSRFKSLRGYCWSCYSIIWLHNGRCCNAPPPTITYASDHQIRPVSAPQIIKYILYGALRYDSSSSDSDSDGEGSPVLGLWAYPRQIRL